jgi:hypothetical protein
VSTGDPKSTTLRSGGHRSRTADTSSSQNREGVRPGLVLVPPAGPQARAWPRRGRGGRVVEVEAGSAGLVRVPTKKRHNLRSWDHSDRGAGRTANSLT